ncbi:hypothetical protein C2S51_009257 [Perilla frutescens var. frutescens]|nr:hypothetical protein C2S51_009257 [Perilla frutescens var. frutescens]
MITHQAAGYNRVSVINPNFCVRHSVDLVITKNVWCQGNFVVENAVNGKIMFKIEGSIFSFDHKRVMLDAAGLPIVILRKKTFALRSTWEVFRGKGKNEKDLIFSVRRASIFQMKTKLVVFMAKNKSEDVCNYTVEGSWFERSCEVYAGDSSVIVAQVSL